MYEVARDSHLDVKIQVLEKDGVWRHQASETSADGGESSPRENPNRTRGARRGPHTTEWRRQRKRSPPGTVSKEVGGDRLTEK